MTGGKISGSAAARQVGVTPPSIYMRCKSGDFKSAVKKGNGWLVDPAEVEAAYAGRPASGKGAGQRGRPRKVRPEGKPKEERQPGREYGTERVEYDGTDYDESRAQVEFWKARKAELGYHVERGELVKASEAQRVYDDHAAAVRSKMLAIPARLRQRIELSPATLELVEDLIREALEEMAEGAFNVQS